MGAGRVEREGQVQEITWRATKLRTKAGQFLIIPNSVIAKEPVLNYSEPTVPTRIDVEVGASYSIPPNEVKRAVQEALANSPLVMKAPEPQVVIKSFGGSAIDYLAQLLDRATTRSIAPRATRFAPTSGTRSAGTTSRCRIRFRSSTSVTKQPLRTDQQVVAAAVRLAAVDLFAALSQEARHGLALSGDEHLFAAGETIVRQGAAGDSMFVVLSGRVRVSIDPAGQEVAVIPAGGFFGEMSMLTGDARTATVKAIEDAVILEISAADFRALAEANPALLDHVSTIVGTRRTGLEEARASAAAIVAPEAKQNFLARMRKFSNAAFVGGTEVPPFPGHYSTQIITRPSLRSLRSISSPGPCFSRSSTRKLTPRSSQPCE